MTSPYGSDTVWVWNADIHCDDCGSEIGDEPDCDGNAPEPWDGSTQESDSPQHCGTCGCFLGCPLTREGYKWLRATLATPAKTEVSKVIREEWRDFYLSGEEEGAEEEKE